MEQSILLLIILASLIGAFFTIGGFFCYGKLIYEADYHPPCHLSRRCWASRLISYLRPSKPFLATQPRFCPVLADGDLYLIEAIGFASIHDETFE